MGVQFFVTQSGKRLVFNEVKEPASGVSQFSLDIQGSNGRNITGMWVRGKILVQMKVVAQCIQDGNPQLIMQELLNLQKELIQNGGYTALGIANTVKEILADDLQVARTCLSNLKQVKQEWDHRLGKLDQIVGQSERVPGSIQKFQMSGDTNRDLTIYKEVIQIIEQLIQGLTDFLSAKNTKDDSSVPGATPRLLPSQQPHSQDDSSVSYGSSNALRRR